jgi:hypothetical protein
MNGLRDEWELALRVGYRRASHVDNIPVDPLEYIQTSPSWSALTPQPYRPLGEA